MNGFHAGGEIEKKIACGKQSVRFAFLLFLGNIRCSYVLCQSEFLKKLKSTAVIRSFFQNPQITNKFLGKVNTIH